MGAVTAQILIGSGHPNHDGIEPIHYLFLSENSRPAWILVNQNLYTSAKKSKNKVVWIPTVDHKLEDALLLIALHVAKNQELITLAKSYCNAATSDRIEICDSYEEDQRRRLYEQCRTITDYPKLVISVFRGSSITNQLPVFEDYKMDVEVCCPIYSRLYSAWSRETTIVGRLKRNPNPPEKVR